MINEHSERKRMPSPVKAEMHSERFLFFSMPHPFSQSHLPGLILVEV